MEKNWEKNMLKSMEKNWESTTKLRMCTKLKIKGHENDGRKTKTLMNDNDLTQKQNSSTTLFCCDAKDSAYPLLLSI